MCCEPQPYKSRQVTRLKWPWGNSGANSEQTSSDKHTYRCVQVGGAVIGDNRQQEQHQQAESIKSY